MSPNYFWFCADVMLKKLETHAPAVLAGTRTTRIAAVTDLDFIRLDTDAIEQVPKFSIDYAVSKTSTDAEDRARRSHERMLKARVEEPDHSTFLSCKYLDG